MNLIDATVIKVIDVYREYGGLKLKSVHGGGIR